MAAHSDVKMAAQMAVHWVLPQVARKVMSLAHCEAAWRAG